MRSFDFEINGGAVVQSKKPLLRMIHLLGTALVLLLLTSTAAFAQGSIFGSVQNSDLSTPANGEISFVGFLDNTDEEIRIESSSGAGYDAGNWFDDFQNYLTEAPGNPYVYFFYNVANDEGAQLANTIPSNSFQQEDILLASVSWPTKPAGLTGTALSSASVLVTWNGAPGVTYHVYRRLSSSSGSLFRIDDPTGSLANAGTVDSFFVDNTTDGISSYDYLIIAEDGSGNLSQHSDIAAINSSISAAPVVTSIVPNNGPTVGGTPVTINGSNFDINGAGALIRVASLTGVTVVSPFVLTGFTPAGTIGIGDVSVTNTASGLVSNTLVGAYTYNANADPVLAAIGPQAVNENAQLTFVASATDVDLDIPIMTATGLPAGATYNDNLNGTGTFDWTPTFTDSGVYTVTFFATDGVVGSSIDSELVTITVNNINQFPVLAAIGPQATDESVLLAFATSAADADGDTPILSATGLPVGAIYTDNLNGTGSFNWTPTFTDSGAYVVTFYATDGVFGSDVDSELVTVTVNNINLEPVLAAIGPQATTENTLLSFVTSATDADGDIPIMGSSTLPVGATYLDNLDGTGSFNWTPTSSDSGVYAVTFYATDGAFGTSIDSELVTITVGNVNLEPVLAAIGPQVVDENVLLAFGTSATDADGDTPVLSSSTLPSGAIYTDNLDGTGAFSWTPTFTDSGSYVVTFYATDGVFGTSIDSELVTITVNNINIDPVLAAIGPQATDENLLLAFATSATDADGDTPTLSTTGLPVGAIYTDNLDGTGSFSWTPTFADSGSYDVTFFATDSAFGASVDSELVTITVTNINQAPILAAIGSQGTTENTLLSFVASASDADGDIPIMSSSTLPVGATYLDNLDGTGTFDWTPTSADSGVYAVTFYATDGVFGTSIDSELVSITVGNVNLEPVLAAIGPQGVDENVQLTFATSAADADGDIPVMTATGLPAGAIYTDNLDGTGSFDWTPTFVQSGIYQVTFYATDGVFGTSIDSEIVTITVNEVGNQLPVLALIGPQAVVEGSTLNLLLTATDAEGAFPLFSADSIPANATLTDNLDGTATFAFSPDLTQEGIYNVNFIVTDDSAATANELVVITVAGTNQEPVLAAIGPQSVDENVLLTFGVLAVDGDSVIPVLTTSAPPVGAIFTDNLDGTGSFDWTPTFADSGVYQVTFYATDGTFGTSIDSEVVAITVIDAGNQLPVLAAIGPQVMAEGDSLNLLITAVDPDGNFAVMSADSLPLNSSFVDNLDGSAEFIFVPDFTQSGSYNVLFIAADSLTADSELVVITVNEVGNLAPVITAINDTTITEGGTLSLAVTSVDPEGDNISLTVSTTLSNFTFVDNTDGTGLFTYTPNFFDASTDTVRFIAIDDGLPQQSSTEPVVIVTTDVNTAPVFDSIGTIYTIAVGSNFGIAVAVKDSTDPVNSNLVLLTATGLPTNATFTDNGDNSGSFTFDPVLGQEGGYSVTIFATDQGSPQGTASLPISITVVGVNQPPVLAEVGAKTVLEGATLTVILAATDPDGTIPTIIGEGLPLNSVFQDNGDGSAVFIFDPDFLQAGLHSVVFKAFDGVSIDKEIVLIQVYEAGNQPPLFTLLPDTGITEGTVGESFLTAADPELQPLTIFIDSSGVLLDNFTLIDSGNGVASFSVAPDFQQAGVYPISIVVDDGQMADTSTLTITIIEAGNQNPIISPVPPVTLKEGQNVNFHVFATDVDGDYPFMTTGPLPGNATYLDMTIGEGIFNWTPGANDNGVYSIQLYAEDGVVPGVFDSTTFTLVVQDSNYVPTIRPDPVVQPLSVFEGETLIYNLLAADADGDIPSIGARMSGAAIGDPLAPNMSFQDFSDGTGTLTFNPDFTQGEGNPTKYFMVFYAIDAVDSTNIAEWTGVTINVLPKNVLPTMNFPSGTGPFTVTEGQNLNFDVIGVDPDAGVPPVITVENQPSTGVTLTGSTDSVHFDFSPSFVQAGQYQLRFIIVDDQAAADTQDVVIDVIEAGNQNPLFISGPPPTLSVAGGTSTSILVNAVDPEAELMTITSSPAITNGSFVDFGDGSATLFFNPVVGQIDSVYTVSFIVQDPSLAADTVTTTISVVLLMRGDADSNRIYSMNDVVYLISYIFRNGSDPQPVTSGDVDNSGNINVSDVAYLVNYMYNSGPKPPQ